MKRSEDYRRFIRSKQWQRLRHQVLTDTPLCEECRRQGIIRAATEVHHVRPVEDAVTPAGQRSLMFSYDNLRALCHDCHVCAHKELGRGNSRKAAARRTDAETEDFKKKYL